MRNGENIILVTGVTGLAGWAYVREWLRGRGNDGLRMEGLISRDSRAPGRWPEEVPLHRFDLWDATDARAAVLLKPWRLIIHADRICRLKFCEKNEATAHRINVTGTHNLVNAIHSLPEGERPRLLFCSTDHVFNGDPCEAPFGPDSPRSPITIYGKLMAEAEDRVQNSLEDSLIIRNGLLLGSGPLGTTGPLDWLQTRLREGRPATYFHNEIRTPLGVGCLGRIGTRLALSSQRGVVHLSMGTRVNRFELALKMLRALDMEGFRHLVRQADRRGDSIQRVHELALKNSMMTEDCPKELAEVLAEEVAGPFLAPSGDQTSTSFRNRAASSGVTGLT